jgi:hypothetical protein
MIDKCANPACEKSFHYFRTGRIFILDSRSKARPRLRTTVEHFWLCGDCAPSLHIVVDESGNAQIEPLDSVCTTT